MNLLALLRQDLILVTVNDRFPKTLQRQNLLKLYFDTTRMHWSCVWEIDPAHITDHISRTWQRQRRDKGFVWKVAMTKEHLKKRRKRSPKQMPVCILGPCVVARWWCSRHVITALPRWLLCANRSATAHSQVGNGCVYYGNKQRILEPYNTVYTSDINKILWLDPITHIKFHKITVVFI